MHGKSSVGELLPVDEGRGEELNPVETVDHEEPTRGGCSVAVANDGDPDSVAPLADALDDAETTLLQLSVAVATADGGLDTLDDRHAKLAVARCVPSIE